MRELLDPAYESFCRAGETIDCEGATGSRFGTFAGVPVATWGLAAYVAMAVLAGTTWLLPLAASAAAAGVAFAAISAFVLRVLCPLCAGTWVVDLALAGLAWRWRREAKPPGRVRSLAARGAAAAILVAGFFATPRAVALEAWREGARFPHGVTEDGHLWIGAENPTVTIDEFVDYVCPHCRTGHARVRAEIERAGGRVRLVRHDWARMACEPIPRNPDNLRCRFSRAAWCAGRQGKFWQMNDYLFTHMPAKPSHLDLDEAARRVGLDIAAFHACHRDRTTYHAVDRENDHAKLRRIPGTPSYVLGGRVLKLAEALREIRDAR